MQIKDWKNTRIYQVENTVEVKEHSENKKSEATYDIAISCSSEKDILRRTFTKENYLLNHTWPEDPTIRLFCQLELAIYPLEIEVDEEEDYLKIPAHRLWFSHWKKKAEKMISEQYHGDFAESIKENFMQAIETEEKLKQKIQEEAFWRLFFFNTYQEKEERTLRWNILKAGSLYFNGEAQTKTQENLHTALYRGKLQKPEEEFIQNLNKLLKFKPNSKNYLKTEDLEATCEVKSTREKEDGKLIYKSAEITLKSKNNSYFYKEKIEIKNQGISLRKTEPSRSFSLFLSEKEEGTN